LGTLRKIAAVILLFLILPGTASCNSASKKPENQPPKKAPEVAKYKEEPTITLYRSKTGKKETLKLEEYIKGVVAAEIGSEFPAEALKAQAIIARTMTLNLIEYEGGTQSTHQTDASDDHTEFQAYDESKIDEKISQAVEATRGQVLVHNGKFIYAVYHSCSKGRTATLEEGMPNLAKVASAYITSVTTDGLKNAPGQYKDWTVKVPKAKIKEIMGPSSGSLDDIKIAKKGPSGRALTITAGDASISGPDLRQEIGFDKLYSTQLTSIEPEGDYMVFKGDGWGHGVGMEQWGAYTMAEAGKKAQEIVKHYFPKAQLTKLYD
jgi:stage II sporulation protein D